jgi:hypothetical protein
MSLARVTQAAPIAAGAAPRARRERASAPRALAPARGSGSVVLGTRAPFPRTVAHPSARSSARCSAAGDSGDSSAFVPWTAPDRLGLAAGWVALGSAAAFVAPAGTSAFDADLIAGLISAPFSGATNPIFEALFNSLGVVPAVYAALLLPGGKDQPRLKPNVPVAASFALGFFALGPYLILREPRDVVGSVRRSDLGWATRTILESKLFAAFNAAFAAFLIVYGITHADAAAVSGFKTLWTEQSALCCVSSCDLLVLSLAMYGVIGEDQKRRGVFSAGKAAAFAAVPVLGPCLWLVARPKLPE